MPRKSITSPMRWAILYRDQFRCRYCGAQAGDEGVKLVVDHAKSVSDGGGTTLDNLVTACQQCNSSKGAMSVPVDDLFGDPESDPETYQEGLREAEEEYNGWSMPWWPEISAKQRHACACLLMNHSTKLVNELLARLEYENWDEAMDKVCKVLRYIAYLEENK